MKPGTVHAKASPRRRPWCWRSMGTSGKGPPRRLYLHTNSGAGRRFPGPARHRPPERGASRQAISRDTAAACRLNKRDPSVLEARLIPIAHADVGKAARNGTSAWSCGRAGTDAGDHAATAPSATSSAARSHRAKKDSPPRRIADRARRQRDKDDRNPVAKARHESPGICFFRFVSAHRQLGSETSTDRLLADCMSALYRSWNHASALTSP